MHKGSCLCGGVKFEIDGDLGMMGNCYCSMCRKHHGSGLVTFVSVKTSDFRWVAGEELLTIYKSSENGRRAFCRVCGSSLGLPEPGADTFFLPAGSLDDDPGQPIAAHVFVGSKAPWVQIHDDAPQFEEFPPGIG